MIDDVFFDASKLQRQQLQWLSPGRIASGCITILEGLPGSAKSTLVYDFGAGVSTGRSLFNAKVETAEKGSVVIFQSEDDPQTTVRPSLEAAGADLTRIILFNNAKQFVLPDDFPKLERVVRQRDVKLVSFDHFADFLKGSPNNERFVRPILHDLAALAQRESIAIILVRHWRKTSSVNPQHNGMGSTAIGGRARSVWAVGPNPNSDDKHEHLLVCVKSNLPTVASSLRFRTVKHANDSITIEWLGEVDYTATDLAKAQSHLNEQSTLREAVYVLHSILQGGPITAKQVVSTATAAQIAKRTLYRAKDILGVRSRKHGGGSGSFWTWELPDQIDPQWLRYLKDRDMDDLCDQLFHGPTENITESLPEDEIDRNPFRDDDDDDDEAPAWAWN